jgi:hypothetical protein
MNQSMGILGRNESIEATHHNILGASRHAQLGSDVSTRKEERWVQGM